jgi:hypothetical protein
VVLHLRFDTHVLPDKPQAPVPPPRPRPESLYSTSAASIEPIVVPCAGWIAETRASNERPIFEAVGSSVFELLDPHATYYRPVCQLF